MFKVERDAEAGRLVAKCGYIDRKGAVVVKPQFEEAWRFSQGRGAVKKDGKWGYIKGDGEYLIRPRFTLAFSFSDGLARVNEGAKYRFARYSGPVGGKWGFIDRSGAFVIPLREVLRFVDFSEGMAGLQLKDGQPWAFVDKSGKVVIKPQFNTIEPFRHGLARVTIRSTSGHHFVDKTGKSVFYMPTIRRKMPARADSDAAINVNELRATYGGYGYVDRTGKVRIPAPSNAASCYGFSEGLASVVIGNGHADRRSGYIDKTGEFVIKPQYARAWDFHEGLAAVKTVGGALKFIDKTGRTVLSFDPPVELVYGFDHGLALIVLGDEMTRLLGEGHRRYIDKQGKTVFQFKTMPFQPPKL